MDESKNQLAKELMTNFKQLKKYFRPSSSVSVLKPSEIMLLFTIKENASLNNEGIMASEISNILSVTSPTVTGLINSLETAGYLLKMTDKADRRAIRIFLTDKAEEFLKVAYENFISQFYEIVTILGDDKSRQLLSLITELNANYSEKKPKRRI